VAFPDQWRDVAVFTIDATQTGELRAGCAPYRGGRTLFDSLEAALALFADVHPAIGMAGDAEGLEIVIGQMAHEIRDDGAGVKRKRADTRYLAPLVETKGKERIGCLRLAIGFLLVVFAGLEVRILEIDRGEAVAA
jgi:hypothetical protein